jgi:uncharacterized repeat protein (TIGR02543 family)
MIPVVTSEHEPPPQFIFKIILHANGGEVDYYELETCEEGKIEELPVPRRENHTFNGWFTSRDDGDEVCSNFVFGANTRIYAQWSEHETPVRTDVIQPPHERENIVQVLPGEAPGGGLLANNSHLPEVIPPGSGLLPEITVGGVLLFAPFGAPVWSLLNFIMVIFGVVFMLAAVSKALFQKKREFKDDDDNMSFSEEMSVENRKKVMWLPVSFVAAILSVFLVLIMQDRSHTMVFTDFWTVAHSILLVTEITAVVLAFQKHKKSVSSMREIENNAKPIHEF